jgi:DNA-binding MarR family transcriptional regulator
MLEIARGARRIVPTVNKLEKRGLAKRTVFPGDGRIRLILLMKRGHQLVRVLKKQVDEHQKKTLARLDPADTRTILSSLWKLAGR